MKRYPAFDPPEYVEWSLEPEVFRAYRACIGQDPERRAIIEGMTASDHHRLYRGLLRNRLHDIALKRWVRNGVISKAWLGTGEEASTIGPVLALKPGDMVAPVIRNAGACHEMGMPLADMFRGYLGTHDSPTRGRDLHIGSLSCGVIAPLSHIATSIPLALGVALGFKLRGEARVALTWIGDGSSRSGDFHEGLNLAAVLQTPLIVVLQNNQVALGTRLAAHSRVRYESIAASYGIPGLTFDGNHVLDAYAATLICVERARRGEGPSLLIGETFRMGGHATHDEREARHILSNELFSWWGKRDPIGLYEAYLREEGLADAEAQARMEAEVTQEVEAEAEKALASRELHPPRPDLNLEGVYAESR
jgi:2-oxoisovalerate dehydrogenase E1 component